MYAKGLYDVVTQNEFFILCNELKTKTDKIGLLKVLRHQFDVSLNRAKNVAENIICNDADVNEVYNTLCKGVLRKPQETEFISVCKSLRENGAMGTLSRLIAEYCDNVNDDTFANLNNLDFSSLKLRNKEDLTYPFRYDD